jgi:hypothetical protein
MGPVIDSYSYRSDVIDKRFHIFSLSLYGKIAFISKYIKLILCFLLKQYLYSKQYYEKFLPMCGNENIHLS